LSERPRTLTSDIQARLMRYYGLDALPHVDDFVKACDDDERERLLVRDADDAVEVALELPAALVGASSVIGLDPLCQVVEGVSHFVLVAERARCELPTTQLELELQAEVDKFVVLAVARAQPLGAIARAALHTRLYEDARFLHPAGTEVGDRYRTAHRLAERYTARLDRDYLGERDARGVVALRERLRCFYRASPSRKIALAEAA
jgi:hypothetical protein